MSIILDEVRRLLKDIRYSGISINGTREIQNFILTFNICNIDSIAEEEAIRDYYNKYIEDYDSRRELEHTHYAKIEASLIHEMTRGQYFSNLDKAVAVNNFAKSLNISEEEVANFINTFNLSNFSSRRNVIFSQDCISFIQLLCRPNKNIMTVVIRSSDALHLLPIDLLFLCYLMKQALVYHNIAGTKIDELKVIIVSCHFYDKDSNIVDRIINNENKSSDLDED